MVDLTADEWDALLAIPDDDYFTLREAVRQEGVLRDLDAMDAEVLRRWRLSQEEGEHGTATPA